MPSGEVMLVDDIDSHAGFATFTKRHPEYQTVIYPSADKDGMFGIAVNGGPDSRAGALVGATRT